jgi:hypothetical protein
MQRRRFALSEARDVPERSESVDGFNGGMKADKPDGDNDKMGYEMSSSDFQPQQDPHDPPRLMSTPTEGPSGMQDSPAKDSDLPGLDARAENLIYDIVLKPLLDRDAFKHFHPLVKSCHRAIQTKQIICLHGLEESLLRGATMLVSGLSCLKNPGGESCLLTFLKGADQDYGLTVGFLSPRSLLYPTGSTTFEQLRANLPN